MWFLTPLRITDSVIDKIVIWLTTKENLHFWQESNVHLFRQQGNHFHYGKFPLPVWHQRRRCKRRWIWITILKCADLGVVTSPNLYLHIFAGGLARNRTQRSRWFIATNLRKPLVHTRLFISNYIYDAWTMNFIQFIYTNKKQSR